MIFRKNTTRHSSLSKPFFSLAEATEDSLKMLGVRAQITSLKAAAQDCTLPTPINS
jgi:hypothetical protein